MKEEKFHEINEKKCCGGKPDCENSKNDMCHCSGNECSDNVDSCCEKEHFSEEYLNLIESIQDDPKIFLSIPPEDRDVFLYEIVISEDIIPFQSIGVENDTFLSVEEKHKLIKLAISISPTVISEVQNKTPELSRYAVELSPFCLRYINIKHLTPDILFGCILSDPFSLEHIKRDDLKDDELYIDLCVRAVSINPYAIRNVETKNIEELAIVIDANKEAIDHIDNTKLIMLAKYYYKLLDKHMSKKSLLDTIVFKVIDIFKLK